MEGLVAVDFGQVGSEWIDSLSHEGIIRRLSIDEAMLRIVGDGPLRVVYDQGEFGARCCPRSRFPRWPCGCAAGSLFCQRWTPPTGPSVGRISVRASPTRAEVTG
jgi:hypothetical protein